MGWPLPPLREGVRVSDDRHMALRIANGETLESVLNDVRKSVWDEGYGEGFDDVADPERTNVTRNPYE